MISRNRLIQLRLLALERTEHVLSSHVFDHSVVSFRLSLSCLDALHRPLRFDNVDLTLRLRIQELVCCRCVE